VLCEKPLASNADEARQMAAAAERSGRRLIEAFHWRFHPLAARMRAVLDSGVLGPLRHVEATMCIRSPLPNDIRYRYDLAGGATMDTGCYAISIARFLAGAEPTVVSAEARLARANVDRWMTAELAFPGGVGGRITCLAVLRDPAEDPGHRPRRTRRDARLQPGRSRTSTTASPFAPPTARQPSAFPARPPTPTSSAPSSPPSATAPRRRRIRRMRSRTWK
jgi:hypothetical protein